MNAPKAEVQREDIGNYEKTALSPSGKYKIIFECKFRIYDGCGVRTMHIRHNGQDKFLYNIDETPYVLRWGHDDKLYGLLYIDGKTHIYNLF